MSTALVVAASAVAAETVLAFGPRRRKRAELFARAVRRSQETGKPLLVLGDPDSGFVTRFFGRVYGCGDACLDLTGCPKCPPPSRLRGRAEEVLPRVRTACVVYVSCVLEYVDDLPLVVSELERVSGGDLFVAHVEAWSLTAFLYPGAKWRILRAPPEGPFRVRSLR